MQLSVNVRSKQLTRAKRTSVRWKHAETQHSFKSPKTLQSLKTESTPRQRSSEPTNKSPSDANFLDYHHPWQLPGSSIGGSRLWTRQILSTPYYGLYYVRTRTQYLAIQLNWSNCKPLICRILEPLWKYTWNKCHLTELHYAERTTTSLNTNLAVMWMWFSPLFSLLHNGSIREIGNFIHAYTYTSKNKKNQQKWNYYD